MDANILRRLGPYARPDDARTLEVLRNAGRLSMLHADVLWRLVIMAAAARGPILEIGAYIGGSTTALAYGARSRGGYVITVERGGSHADHWLVPTHDIIRDLKRNLAKGGYSSTVTVFEGLAQQPSVQAQVRARLAEQKAGMLVLDSDGEVARTLVQYRRFLADDALLVVDDYDAAGVSEKEATTKPVVDSLMRRGVLRQFGVFAHGTWFGRLSSDAPVDAMDSITVPFARESGHCCIFPFYCLHRPDTGRQANRSQLELFEDGRPLGPAHSLHAAIREAGAGRYSHWAEVDACDDLGFYSSCLYFSTSDNSDPNANGRKYSIVLDGVSHRPIDLLTYMPLESAPAD